ncbi:MAG: formylmethanofuran dehydrogenase subunit B [Methanosarcinales archaeon]|nr:formylmethanofuran dehydrogenase subunit B [Methanosarcinales archaeon]
MAVCTGCSLLCEDIEVALDGGKMGKTRNLCRKGLGHFKSIYLDRARPAVDGKEAGIDEAIDKAAGILKNAKKPLIFGWSNSTLDAQKAGLELARELGAVVDDTSSICQGWIVEKVLRKEIPTCTLDDVRNYADVSIFWGSDPSSSHPRHLSRFSYYPRGEKRQRGYEEDRTAITIDVRKSPTADISDEYYRVLPGGDAGLVEAMISVLDGKIPRVEDKKKLISLVTNMKKSRFGVIFPGLGMVYSLKGRKELLDALVEKLNQSSRYSVIPMVGHYNMRGFNQTLLDQTGFINRVSFQDGVESGPEHSVMEAAKTCDAALVIGSDPVSSLPAAVARRLAGMPVVAVDPHRNLTTDVARVVIPSAASGLEAGGSALRMDGVEIKFDGVVESERMTDLEILARIKEGL